MDIVQILLPLWVWEGTYTVSSLCAVVKLCTQCRPKIDHLPALEFRLASIVTFVHVSTNLTQLLIG